MVSISKIFKIFICINVVTMKVPRVMKHVFFCIFSSVWSIEHVTKIRPSVLEIFYIKDENIYCQYQEIIRRKVF